MNKRPLVSSLSVMFKRATTVSDDVDEVKRAHRANLKTLVDDYMLKVQTGKAEGIKSARELVEVIKADLLLLGEATERNETNTVDQIKINQISKVLDEQDPQVKAVLDSLFDAMNGVNDSLDHNYGNKDKGQGGDRSTVDELVDMMLMDQPSTEETDDDE